jgi:hypothetical protein
MSGRLSSSRDNSIHFVSLSDRSKTEITSDAVVVHNSKFLSFKKKSELVMNYNLVEETTQRLKGNQTYHSLRYTKRKLKFSCCTSLSCFWDVHSSLRRVKTVTVTKLSEASLKPANKMLSSSHRMKCPMHVIVRK